MRNSGPQDRLQAIERGRRVGPALPRAHELEGVAARAQPLDHRADRARDAVDLGGVGLGDDGDPIAARGSRIVHAFARWAAGMKRS
jgi:predicted metal-dependent phosphoesterase TrpH